MPNYYGFPAVSRNLICLKIRVPPVTPKNLIVTVLGGPKVVQCSPTVGRCIHVRDGIIKASYETGSGPAGQARQWARDRTLYVPDVRFTIFMNENGKTVARQFTYQEFADMADPITVKNGYYEHEIHRVTYRYGDWAHVISTSEERRTPTGPVTGHWIDNIELLWDGGRWWISSGTFIEERPNEPLPKEYLP